MKIAKFLDKKQEKIFRIQGWAKSSRWDIKKHGPKKREKWINWTSSKLKTFNLQKPFKEDKKASYRLGEMSANHILNKGLEYILQYRDCGKKLSEFNSKSHQAIQLENGQKM